MLLLPIMLQAFSHKTANNPVKAPEIVKNMTKYILSKGYKIKMTEARLRKFVNYIRSKSLLPLIATPKGYYVSYEKRIVEMQLKSLEERANSILSARNGLVPFANMEEKVETEQESEINNGTLNLKP